MIGTAWVIPDQPSISRDRWTYALSRERAQGSLNSLGRHVKHLVDSGDCFEVADPSNSLHRCYDRPFKFAWTFFFQVFPLSFSASLYGVFTYVASNVRFRDERYEPVGM